MKIGTWAVTVISGMLLVSGAVQAGSWYSDQDAIEKPSRAAQLSLLVKNSIPLQYGSSSGLIHYQAGQRKSDPGQAFYADAYCIFVLRPVQPGTTEIPAGSQLRISAIHDEADGHGRNVSLHFDDPYVREAMCEFPRWLDRKATVGELRQQLGAGNFGIIQTAT